MEIDNIISLKLKNVKDVIRVVRFSDHMSRKTLANILGLSFATISNISNSLIEQGIFQEDSANGEKTVGRSTKYILLNKDKYKIVGISLEGKGVVRFCIVNLKNEIIAQKTMRCGTETDIISFVEQLTALYFAFLDELKLNETEIIGVGVAVPAIFNRENECIVSSEIPLLENQPLKRYLEDRLKKDVFIDNDANLCVISIKNKVESENIVYMFISEGLGIGALHNGRMMRGERGFATEICHFPLGKLDKKCWLCGSYDCLQTDISKSGFADKYSIAIKKTATWDEFLCALRSNESAALSVAAENAAILGKALSSVVNLLDSQKVIIGGVPQELYSAMSDDVLREINIRKIVHSMDDFELFFDDESYENIILGATEVVFDKWYPNI